MNTENLYKLVTKKDIYHIHKSLGIITFIHFIYQFNHIFFYGHMNLDSHVGLYLVGLHGVLSISSFIFYIPNIINPKTPIIYSKYRLHNIIFSLRAVICIYLAYYKLNMSYRIFTCFLTMISTDIITYVMNNNEVEYIYDTFWNKPHKPLIKNMPFDEGLDKNMKKNIMSFYNSNQVAATLYMMGTMDTAFFTLYGIQLSVFFMTLVRKNIIYPNMWHTLYTLILISNVFGLYSVPLSFIFCQIPLYYLFIHMNFSNNINKYFAWTITFYCFYILNYVFCEICPVDIIFTSSQELYIKRGLILYNFITNMKFLV